MDNPRVKQVTTEDLRDWFGKGKEGGAGGGGWDRYNTKGERIGKCGDAEDRGGDGEGKPKCLSKEKAAQLRAKGGKEAIANAVKRKKDQDSVTDRQGTGNAPRPVSNRIGEDVLSEKNVPTNPGLWSRAKSAAKAKFDVYPSAYANGWASKWYKSKGGGWKSEETEDPSDTQSATSADLEWGSDSATRIYRAMTPGQENEAWEKNPNCQQCGKKLSPQDLKKGNRICVTCHKKNKGKVWGNDADDKYEEMTKMAIPSFKVYLNEENLRQQVDLHEMSLPEFAQYYSVVDFVATWAIPLASAAVTLAVLGVRVVYDAIKNIKDDKERAHRYFDNQARIARNKANAAEVKQEKENLKKVAQTSNKKLSE